MDYQAAAKQIKAGAKRLQWVSDMAEALDKIGSIEAAEKVAQEKLDKAKGEAASQDAALQQLVEATAAQSNEMSEILITGKKELEQNIKTLEDERLLAVGEAEEVVKSAHKQAAHIIGTARNQAESTKESAKGAAKELEASKKALAEAKENYLSVTKAIEDAKAKAKAAIDAMRSDLS